MSSSFLRDFYRRYYGKEIIFISHKIIKPEGIELIEYLNNGYAICNRRGAVMRQTEDPKTGCGIYICPSCGLKMDEEDYEYESDEEVEWTEEMLDMEQGDIPPAGCRACGLQMIYICILALKDTLICVLEWLRTDFIRP
jgi:hypothetical protein